MTLKTKAESEIRSTYYRGHELFIARLQDQFDFVEQRQMPVLTSFLTPVEQRIMMQQAPKNLFISFYGGYKHAIRKMACIQTMDLEPNYDYVILKSIYTPQKRSCTHKDVLGALMHLGLQRNQLGDIFVDDTQILLVCKEGLAEFICRECHKIANVFVDFKEDYSVVFPAAAAEIVTVHVASLRMDAIIAALAHCSRFKAMDLLKSGWVKLNDVVLEENDRLCNNDYVSIRKTGRFQFLGVESHTRKDRLILRFEKYV